MGWLITLGILLGLAVLPIGISVIYDHLGPVIRLMVGPVRVKIFPAKKKDKNNTGDKKPVKATKKKEASTEKKKKGGALSDFLPLVEVILEFLCKFKSKIRVNRLELTVILAGDDPCDLAINYGKAWAALGNLMPQLERFFIIKKRDLEVECDFTADKPQIFARLDLTITVGRLIALAVVYGWRLLEEYKKFVKVRKGGAKI